MARVYRTHTEVDLSITWSYTLVDDSKKGKYGEDFYLRLTPHINRGGKAGSSRVVRVEEGNYSKIVPQKQILSEQKTKKIELELINQILKDTSLKKEIADRTNRALKGNPLSKISSTSVSIEPKNPTTNKKVEKNIEEKDEERLAQERQEREERAEAVVKAEQLAKTDPFAEQMLRGRKDTDWYKE